MEPQTVINLGIGLVILHLLTHEVPIIILAILALIKPVKKLKVIVEEKIRRICR